MLLITYTLKLNDIEYVQRKFKIAKEVVLLSSDMIIQVFYIIFLLVGLWGCYRAWVSQTRTETIHPWKAFTHLLAYYLSYLLFPLLIFALVGYTTSYFSLVESISLTGLSLLLIYARFIEPDSIQVDHHHLKLDANTPLSKPLKIALIADLHVGLFTGDEHQLKKIVRKLNEAQPDVVLVAGDWTYEPENTLVDELYMLKDIQAPVYSVNGNHDEQYPGPPIQELLARALKENGVMDIEGQVLELDEVRILGVGDLWAGKTDMRHLPDLPQDKPWLILSHNPDTVDMVPELPHRPLMLSGHTHGGQVKLPYLTQYMLNRVSILGHVRGLYHHQHADVFVTVGTGMVGVPFRFLVPPTIDILHLT